MKRESERNKVILTIITLLKKLKLYVLSSPDKIFYPQV